MLSLLEFVILFIVVAAVIVFATVRPNQGGKLGGSRGFTRICPSEHCRYHNDAHAVFCARCGHRLIVSRG